MFCHNSNGVVDTRYKYTDRHARAGQKYAQCSESRDNSPVSLSVLKHGTFISRVRGDFLGACVQLARS